MPTIGPPANAPTVLPALVAAYVEATNSFDLERLLATFADDALVNDQLRDYWGKSAIREWAERDIIGERLTMDVTEVIEHYSNVIVTANVDGKYDKRGMPDPLVLAFYFTPHGNRIVQLIILRNQFNMSNVNSLRDSPRSRVGIMFAHRYEAAVLCNQVACGALQIFATLNSPPWEDRAMLSRATGARSMSRGLNFSSMAV